MLKGARLRMDIGVRVRIGQGWDYWTGLHNMMDGVRVRIGIRVLMLVA